MKNIKTTTIEAIVIIIFAIACIFVGNALRNVSWNNGHHFCGGAWQAQGMVMTGRDHRTVEYLYICEDCGTTWVTGTNFTK